MIATSLAVDNPALNWPKVGKFCCVGDQFINTCCCGTTERVLRAYVAGKVLLPMTGDQRTWCLNQIGQVEGHTVSEYAHDDDATLAKAVLDCWAEYARDKRLL